MGRYVVFLRWWILFMLISLGSTITYMNGMMDRLNLADTTHISLVIFLAFILSTLYTGYITWKSCKNDITTMDQIKALNHKASIGWFIGDAFLTLGMIGTVAGFIYMLIVADLTHVTTETIPVILAGMSSGMGIALYTTITGLVCSLALKLQLFNLDYHLDHISRVDICGEL